MEYQKYEFCKSVNCDWLNDDFLCFTPKCIKSARDFYRWLKENDYQIIKSSNPEPTDSGDTKLPIQTIGFAGGWLDGSCD